jgi:hypothetical protein
MVYRALVEMATRRRGRGKGTKRVRGGGGCTSKNAVKGQCVEPPAAAAASRPAVAAASRPAVAAASRPAVAANARPSPPPFNFTTATTRIAKYTSDIAAKEREITALEATIAAKKAQITALLKTDRPKSLFILKSKKRDEEKLETQRGYLRGLTYMKEAQEKMIAARHRYDVAIRSGPAFAKVARIAYSQMKQISQNMERRTGPALARFAELSINHGLTATASGRHATASGRHATASGRHATASGHHATASKPPSSSVALFFGPAAAAAAAERAAAAKASGVVSPSVTNDLTLNDVGRRNSLGSLPSRLTNGNNEGRARSNSENSLGSLGSLNSAANTSNEALREQAEHMAANARAIGNTSQNVEDIFKILKNARNAMANANALSTGVNRIGNVLRRGGPTNEEIEAELAALDAKGAEGGRRTRRRLKRRRS